MTKDYPICSINECDKPSLARGWCTTHYGRWQRHGDPHFLIERTRKPCSIDGCDKLSRARGWCKSHWVRWKNYGDPLGTPPERPTLLCSVSDCTRKYSARGYCRMHYIRWQEHGDPLAVLKTGPPRSDPTECSVDDCDRIARPSSGYCRLHHNRWRKHGDPLKVGTPGRKQQLPPPKDPKATECSEPDCDRSVLARGLCNLHYGRARRDGKLNIGKARLVGIGPPEPRYSDDGYLIVYDRRTGRNRGAHRVIMEGMLDRDLLPGENVHHINGKRDDNRPCNLELWVKSQPSGQRVIDKLAWAREIIAQYEPIEHLLGGE